MTNLTAALTFLLLPAGFALGFAAGWRLLLDLIPHSDG